MALREPVPAPLAGPPRFGLLVAATVLRDALRWEQGYTFVPEACERLGGVVDPCDTGTLDIQHGHPADVEATPFAVWDADQCSTMGSDPADIAARARRSLEANESEYIAREFWTGTLSADAAWGNQQLADPALTPVGEGASVAAGIALLEAALAAQQGNRRGMLHLDARTFSLAATTGQLRREGTLWLTGLDHIVVTDAGYDGSSPDGDAPTDEATWGYATGLVTVRLSEVMTSPADPAWSVASRVNTITATAARLASPSWDGCAHAAVSFDLTLPPLGSAPAAP